MMKALTTGSKSFESVQDEPGEVTVIRDLRHPMHTYSSEDHTRPLRDWYAPRVPGVLRLTVTVLRADLAPAVRGVDAIAFLR